MMQTLTIGQGARRAGVGVATVRFYERQGLIAAPARGVSGVVNLSTAAAP